LPTFGVQHGGFASAHSKGLEESAADTGPHRRVPEGHRADSEEASCGGTVCHIRVTKWPDAPLFCLYGVD
jgi:hypothetical protein